MMRKYLTAEFPVTLLVVAAAILIQRAYVDAAFGVPSAILRGLGGAVLIVAAAWLLLLPLCGIARIVRRPLSTATRNGVLLFLVAVVLFIVEAGRRFQG
jgi:hypothetical protein